MVTPNPAVSLGIAKAGARRLLWRRLLTPGLLVAFLVLVAFAIHHLAEDVRYSDVADALSQVSLRDLLLAGLFTGLSFFALSFYDVSGLEYAGRRLPYRFVALTSFCAYAIGNTAGFGPLSGGAVRYRFYTPLGLGPEEIARIVGFVTAGFGLGLAATAALGLSLADGTIAGILGASPPLLRLAGFALLGAVLVPVALSLGVERTLRVGRIRVPLPRTGLLLRQLAITLIDIAASATVLWVLLPEGAIGLPAFVAIYSVAVGIGVLSHVPAGLGVFETIVIAALKGVVPVDQLLGALVLYRLVYHALPLAVATMLVVVLETRRILAGPAATKLVASAERLAPPVLASLGLLTGGMLVLSGLTPGGAGRAETLAAAVPLPIVEGAHFLSSVLGTILLVSSRGLLFRLDGAWWVSVLATGLALAFAPLKALAIGEALVLCLLLVALLLARHDFSRPSSLLHETLSRRWSIAIATILAASVAVMLFAYKEVQYTNEMWWQFEFAGDAPRSLRALVGVAVTTAMVAVWSLTRPWPGPASIPTQDDLDLAAAIVRRQPSPEAGLALMGDKALMFSDDREAFVMFARQGRSWVALFDPVGRPESWPGLIWRFVETARQHGGRAVFYEVGPEHLALYADAGLTAFRLGESARLDLAAFDLTGPRRAQFRNALRKGERSGLDVDIVAVEDVPAIIDELNAISDAWLAHHKVREKGFSLGAFARGYVSLQPVARLRKDGRTIAFATLMMTDLKHEISFDLIRFLPTAPNGAMDFLILKLILLFKEQGYEWLDLGMAPLSGFRDSRAATIWNRVGRAVFEHGERFYHFQGLRNFKDKFDPEWRPRYMVVSGGLNPLIALADVTVLISGGVRGVVSK